MVGNLPAKIREPLERAIFLKKPGGGWQCSSIGLAQWIKEFYPNDACSDTTIQTHRRSHGRT